MLTRWEKPLLVAGLVVALVGIAARPADAARSWAVPPLPPANTVAYTPKVPIQRVGLNCAHTEYLIWGVRYCVTIRARKTRLGRWEFQPSAAIAGYNAQGRRAMRFLTAVRLNGRSSYDAAKTRRLVVRGPWQVGTGQAGQADAVFVFRWPNGRKSAVKLSSHA